jgi:hypothetical protein
LGCLLRVYQDHGRIGGNEVPTHLWLVWAASPFKFCLTLFHWISYQQISYVKNCDCNIKTQYLRQGKTTLNSLLLHPILWRKFPLQRHVLHATFFWSQFTRLSPCKWLSMKLNSSTNLTDKQKTSCEGFQMIHILIYLF